MGTVPHGLIAAYEGDTVAAAKDFARHYASEMNVTVLVDWENDATRTAVEVADALGDDLWGVRVDTSGTLVDKALWSEMERPTRPFVPTGVNERLVEKVRAALDAAGHERVKIVVSGGFTVDRIPGSRPRACRPTRTASAPRSSAATTTTPPTSSG